jgi:hypothetical protein
LQEKCSISGPGHNTKIASVKKRGFQGNIGLFFVSEETAGCKGNWELMDLPKKIWGFGGVPVVGIFTNYFYT